MTIDEFLRLRDTELAAVMANVEATTGLGAGDVLLAVGSLAEGLGNSKSDLDLLLLTPRGKSSLASEDHAMLVAGRCLVDVRILRLAEIDELLARFENWSQLAWNVTHAVKFTLEERTLLHRLLHGHLLHKGDKEQLTARIPRLADLARLKLHVARQASRTVQVDMAGYREARDFGTLVFAAQDLLGHATDALLAGYHLTNPISKWRNRLLQAVPPEWESSLGIRPTGLTAARHVWRLHRAPERPDERPALEHAFRITTFARAVFMWAENRLLRGATAQRKPLAWSGMERDPDEPPLPCLDLDVDFFLADGHVTIARLNEFDETLRMSPREFALALLFDGATTRREAEQFFGAGRRGRVQSSAVEKLLSRMARLGLVVSPPGDTRRRPAARRAGGGRS